MRIDAEPAPRVLDPGQRVADAVLRMYEEAGDTLSLTEVVRRICRLAVELVPADRSALYLWDESREAIVGAAQHGTPIHILRRFARHRDASTIAFKRELRAGETIVVTRETPRSAEGARWLADGELYALAIVPLRSSGKTVGSLTLGLTSPPGFSETGLDVARGMARQGTPLIDNARLFSRLEKSAAFRAGVAQLAAALNAFNDRTVIARLVCKRGAELFEVSSGLLFRRDGESLVVAGATGRGTEGAATLTLSLEDERSPVVEAFRNARPVFVNDVGAGGADVPSPARELGLRSLLAVPLIGAGGTGGCLVYGDTRLHAFTQAIAEEGAQLAAVAAGAIERAHSAEADEARHVAENHADDLARHADELTEARNAALAAATAKAEFLANMSHEIRTPMTAILGYLHILSRSDTSEGERQSHVAIIRRNGEHLLRILNDILDASKIEAGKLTIERAPCSPIELVAEVTSLMRTRADEKGLGFAVEATGPVPDTISTDSTRLRQVLVNLVSNAIKFTEAGSVRLRLGVVPATEDHAPALRFDVVDTGVGLSADAVEKLFAPFTQADASTTRRFGGTGLGLAISKRLAQMLGGDIAVRSVPGEGSVFSLSIETGPLDGVTMVAHADFEPAPPRVEARSAPAPTLRARVLLAEDTPDTQALIAYYLRKAGAKVEVVNNGLAACERTLAARDAGTAFDVVLMDMQMPELDGEQATQRLRSAGYTGPIVALTAHAMQSERDKCLRAGCNAFASKPIEPETLIATVRQYASAAAVEPADEARPIVSTLEGDDALMALLQAFVDGLSTRVAALERSLCAGDLAAVANQAHQVKGSSGGYGFASLSEAAGRLEESARAGECEDSVRRALDVVADLCRRARARAVKELTVEVST